MAKAKIFFLVAMTFLFTDVAAETELRFTENRDGDLYHFQGDIETVVLFYEFSGRCSDRRIPTRVIDSRTLAVDTSHDDFVWNGFAGKEIDFCASAPGYREKRDLSLRRGRDQGYTFSKLR